MLADIWSHSVFRCLKRLWNPTGIMKARIQWLLCEDDIMALSLWNPLFAFHEFSLCPLLTISLCEQNLRSVVREVPCRTTSRAWPWSLMFTTRTSVWRTTCWAAPLWSLSNESVGHWLSQWFSPRSATQFHPNGFQGELPLVDVAWHLFGFRRLTSWCEGW